MTDALRALLDGLFLVLTLSAPVLAVAFAVGAVVALAQSATRLLEPSLNSTLRLASVLLALAFLGPWMGLQLVQFATKLYASLPQLAR